MSDSMDIDSAGSSLDPTVYDYSQLARLQQVGY